MDATTITTLVIAVLGSGGLGALATKYWESRRKDGVQSHSQYMAMFARQDVRIAVLEKEVDECHEEKATIREELGAVREALRRVEGTHQQAVIISDDQGTIIDWNPIATQMFGWSSEDAVGQPIDMLIPDNRLEEHHVAFARAVKEERGPRAGAVIRDAYAKRRDGSQIPVTIMLRSRMDGGLRRYTAEITRRS